MLKKSEKIIIVKRVTKEDLNTNNDEIKKYSFWSDLNKNWLSLSPIIRDFLLKGLWELIKKVFLFFWNFFISDN